MKKFLERSLLLSILVVFTISGNALGINSKAGTTGADFLKVDPDTMSQAVGGMSYGYGEYASRIFLNPALSAYAENISVSLGASSWLAGSKFNMVSVIVPFGNKSPDIKPAGRRWIKKRGRRSISRRSESIKEGESGSAFGIGIIYFDAGDLKETTLDQFSQVVETGNSLSAKDLCGVLSFSRGFNFISAGVNLKYIQRKLASESASTFAIDIGFSKNVYSFPYGKVYCGLVAENLGGKLDFISATSHKDELPVNYGFGAACRYKEFVVLANIAKPVDNDIAMNIGLNYYALEQINVRAGYKVLGQDKDAIGGTLTGFSLGAGFPLKLISGEISYSYVPYNDLDNTHHLSFNVNFGSADSNSWFRD